jgi:glutamine synthetase
MRKHVSQSTFQALHRSIQTGQKLSKNDANVIAHAMMEWAISKGAASYTHWFQPMTGRTAQKHDAFLSLDSDQLPIERFSGTQLIQSEPDASSFPSGGMRSTFEARGYTAWDPSSPVFIMEVQNVSVLFIPSVFFTYTGHTLDKKTPLLRSVHRLNQAAQEALELLGENVVPVTPTIGAEQEYFLVDQKYYEQRPDLVMTGRTLLGARPPKGQQMEDHYFGSIKDRVLIYMDAVERALFRLGVPCKTRHNEVAPHQYEMAPIFLEANLAADQNQLVMEVMQKKAIEFGLHALLHEKPFAGINGSGKHLNWSLQTESGTNLLDPGETPHRNITFLYFLIAVVDAIYHHGGLLRSTIASAGNDHRLGANEAPPAIMSVFLGKHLSDMLDKIEKSEVIAETEIDEIRLGIMELPNVPKDNTDRNRTSPFAFTGNKFEFRAVGSGQSISLPTTVLNAAVAQSLTRLNKKLELAQDKSTATVLNILRTSISESKAVRFEGNNYSAEWEEEALQRGLPNTKTTPEALDQWENEDSRVLMNELEILSTEEMDARLHVKREGYSKTLDIEASTLLRMLDNYVLPSAFRYQGQLSQSIQQTGTLLNTPENMSAQVSFVKDLRDNINGVLNGRRILQDHLARARAMEEPGPKAHFYAKTILPAMSDVRSYADRLELIVGLREWDLPTYHDLLFRL